MDGRDRRYGHGSGAAGEEEERRKDEKDVEVDTAQPERQRQRRPRQRVVRAPEHPRLPALSIPGLLRRPVQPAIRAHLGGGPGGAGAAESGIDGVSLLVLSWLLRRFGPASEAVGSGGGAAPDPFME